MSSNSTQIIHQLRCEFQELIEYVTGGGSHTRTAYEVELTLFRRLLTLGAKLLHLFFVQRAAVRPSGPVYAPDGTALKYHDRRPTTYFSVFGKIRFRRHYFHAPGQEGFCPLDADLSLPPRCYSDLLRDWAEYCITSESYDESIKVLQRILSLSISKRALETGVSEDAADVNAFYEQKAVPPAEAEGAILVVQADGKGVPMVRTEPAATARATATVTPTPEPTTPPTPTPSPLQGVPDIPALAQAQARGEAIQAPYTLWGTWRTMR